MKIISILFLVIAAYSNPAQVAGRDTYERLRELRDIPGMTAVQCMPIKSILVNEGVVMIEQRISGHSFLINKKISGCTRRSKTIPKI